MNDMNEKQKETTQYSDHDPRSTYDYRLGRLEQAEEDLTRIRRIQAQLTITGNGRRLIFTLDEELEATIAELKGEGK